jgi:hypothetical protein
MQLWVHTRCRLYVAAAIFLPVCTTHHPPNCRLCEASRNSSTQFRYISARINQLALQRVQASAWRTSTSLHPQRLKPLSPNRSGADRPGLLVMSCRGKRKLIGSENDCSVVPLAVHGLRRTLSSSSSMQSKRDKNARFSEPRCSQSWRTSCKVLQPMSRRTNYRAAISCKSPGRRANTNDVHDLPQRHPPRSFCQGSSTTWP